MKTITSSRRQLLIGAGATGAMIAMPAVLRAQAAVIRWGELLAVTHPQVQMLDRIAKEVKEKSSGRIDIQVFPNGQLGSGKDMIESVSSGALQFTTDGAGALGAFLPQLSLIEAPYLWRDAAHLAKVTGTPVFGKMNDDLAARRNMRMLNVTYYGKRHLTTGSKAVQTPADMVGFKLRVPPVDVFRAMAEAWGARPTPIAFPELYLALSQGAVDGQENPLPTIQSGKFFEVQKFLILTEHIITPRMIIVNEAFWKGLPAADRALLQAAFDSGAAWQDKELLAQEGTLVATLKAAGMTVIEPDLAAWRKPVLDTVPAKFEERWGKGAFDALKAL
ncbi:MAG: sialic acid TRAP transporter substrate-binding protein SiaP [Methylocystis sp.]|jgi:tripartite ATP-independent transporter DctP family solute receptor|nr:sialic acid TRAP transporter substrate-binding protein SiaP [Methylocystis sp.]MCA3583062.1 sialic acid TRAP transporter substrate-binding protein SiaP [Methylocystis sp.]MCA3588112.1 sialic acid TRAP transporter substrate-binding protein SiaP [Methylocystis sp.]MCA3593401.1 sialic acid TRAP transporter substrate-binding protein SiaP [Methylocystis sp.]